VSDIVMQVGDAIVSALVFLEDYLAGIERVYWDGRECSAFQAFQIVQACSGIY
jgi:hypothetical protein